MLIEYITLEKFVSLFHTCHPLVYLHWSSDARAPGWFELHCRIEVVVLPDGCHQGEMVDGDFVWKLPQQEHFDPGVLFLI